MMSYLQLLGSDTPNGYGGCCYYGPLDHPAFQESSKAVALEAAAHVQVVEASATGETSSVAIGGDTATFDRSTAPLSTLVKAEDGVPATSSLIRSSYLNARQPTWPRAGFFYSATPEGRPPLQPEGPSAPQLQTTAVPSIPRAAAEAGSGGNEGYIFFNCPEGAQRFSSEANIKLKKVRCFCFTRWSSTSGGGASGGMDDPTEGNEAQTTPRGHTSMTGSGSVAAAPVGAASAVMGLPGLLFTINDAGVRHATFLGPSTVLGHSHYTSALGRASPSVPCTRVGPSTPPQHPSPPLSSAASTGLRGFLTALRFHYFQHRPMVFRQLHGAVRCPSLRDAGLDTTRKGTMAATAAMMQAGDSPSPAPPGTTNNSEICFVETVEPPRQPVPPLFPGSTAASNHGRPCQRLSSTSVSFIQATVPLSRQSLLVAFRVSGGSGRALHREGCSSSALPRPLTVLASTAGTGSDRAASLDTFLTADSQDLVLGYAVVVAPGAAFDVSKARALGVRSGPKYSQLKQGMSVEVDAIDGVIPAQQPTLSDAAGLPVPTCKAGARPQRWVHSQEVMRPTTATKHSYVSLILDGDQPEDVRAALTRLLGVSADGADEWEERPSSAAGTDDAAAAAAKNANGAGELWTLLRTRFPHMAYYYATSTDTGDGSDAGTTAREGCAGVGVVRQSDVGEANTAGTAGTITKPSVLQMRPRQLCVRHVVHVQPASFFQNFSQSRLKGGNGDLASSPLPSPPPAHFPDVQAAEQSSLRAGTAAVAAVSPDGGAEAEGHAAPNALLNAPRRRQLGMQNIYAAYNRFVFAQVRASCANHGLGRRSESVCRSAGVSQSTKGSPHVEAGESSQTMAVRLSLDPSLSFTVADMADEDDSGDDDGDAGSYAMNSGVKGASRETTAEGEEKTTTARAASEAVMQRSSPTCKCSAVGLSPTSDTLSSRREAASLQQEQQRPSSGCRITWQLFTSDVQRRFTAFPTALVHRYHLHFLAPSLFPLHGRSGRIALSAPLPERYSATSLRSGTCGVSGAPDLRAGFPRERGSMGTPPSPAPSPASPRERCSELWPYSLKLRCVPEAALRLPPASQTAILEKDSRRPSSSIRGAPTASAAAAQQARPMAPQPLVSPPSSVVLPELGSASSRTVAAPVTEPAEKAVALGEAAAARAPPRKRGRKEDSVSQLADAVVQPTDCSTVAAPKTTTAAAAPSSPAAKPPQRPRPLAVADGLDSLLPYPTLASAVGLLSTSFLRTLPGHGTADALHDALSSGASSEASPEGLGGGCGGGALGFLGTGSAIPSKYRNVSGAFLELHLPACCFALSCGGDGDGDASTPQVAATREVSPTDPCALRRGIIILDFGEGSVGQMASLCARGRRGDDSGDCGVSETPSVALQQEEREAGSVEDDNEMDAHLRAFVLDIVLLFISHAHADHHLGLLSFLTLRHHYLEQRRNASGRRAKLLVVCPTEVYCFLMDAWGTTEPYSMWLHDECVFDLMPPPIDLASPGVAVACQTPRHAARRAARDAAADVQDCVDAQPGRRADDGDGGDDDDGRSTHAADIPSHSPRPHGVQQQVVSLPRLQAQLATWNRAIERAASALAIHARGWWDAEVMTVDHPANAHALLLRFPFCASTGERDTDAAGADRPSPAQTRGGSATSATRPTREEHVAAPSMPNASRVLLFSGDTRPSSFLVERSWAFAKRAAGRQQEDAVATPSRRHTADSAVLPVDAHPARLLCVNEEGGSTKTGQGAAPVGPDFPSLPSTTTTPSSSPPVFILLHEATFGPGFEAEAVRKKHSTLPEALDVGAAVQAEFVILNHFSQRYPKLPGLTQEQLEGRPTDIVRQRRNRVTATTAEARDDARAEAIDQDMDLTVKVVDASQFTPTAGASSLQPLASMSSGFSFAFDLMSVSFCDLQRHLVARLTPTLVRLLEEYDSWGISTTQRMRGRNGGQSPAPGRPSPSSASPRTPASNGGADQQQ